MTIPLPAILQRGGQPRALPLASAAVVANTFSGISISVDCETSGYPLGHPDYALRTVQVGTKTVALDLDASDPEQLALAAAVLDAASEIVAHSATADISLLAVALGRDAAPWWAKATDTMVLAALADPRAVGGMLGLEKLTDRLLESPYKPTTARARQQLFSSNGWLTETRPETPVERSGWANVPVGDPVMVKYAAADVLDAAELREVLPEPSPTVFERERRLHGILARVTERGLRLDGERVASLIAEHTEKRDEALAELSETWGLSSPGSNRDVAAALTELGAGLPRTAKGNVSVAGDAIDKVAAADGPAQALALALLRWRKHEKLLGTYLLALEHQCRGTGRTHPTIHQLGARATGRMSSSGPNIQNWPRPSKAEKRTTGGLRGMVIADPGHAFISADFSSVEVRLAAAVTGDAVLAGMVREGLDLHGRVVELVWGVSEDHPSYADLRYTAKRAVFGYLYGAGLKRVAMQLGEHGDKAGEVIEALSKITPELFEWNKLIRKVVERGAMETWEHPSGRVAFFDKDSPHKALNTVVQGWGREVLVDAILRWEDKHPGCMLWPIHDELVIQVPEEHAEAWLEDLRECMTFTLGRGGAQVPIVAEADAPTGRWGVESA